ncbi:MAG: hypothetical protein NC453_19015 [Muribaculum sp.]|nr:hypothetical protein [Muribaculum sp.]
MKVKDNTDKTTENTSKSIGDTVKKYKDEYNVQLKATLSSNYLEGNDDKFIFINPVGDVFPIIAHTPCPQDKDVTKEGARMLKECGFNCVHYDPAINNLGEANETLINRLNNQLNIFGSEGIRVLLSLPSQIYTQSKAENTEDSEIKQETQDYVNSLKMNSALGGWAFKNFIPFTKFDKYSILYNTIFNADENHLILFYLDGGFWEGAKPGCTGLCDYLNKVQSQFKPSVWSFQSFPFYGDSIDSISTAYGDFFNALEIYSQRAKITQRPLWAFCQCMHFSNKLDPPTVRPVSSMPLLRFQVYTALAYGAQGIIYYTYALPADSAFNIYYSALIDNNGERLQAWYDVQKMNRELKAYLQVFYECQIWDVRIAGPLWRSPCTQIEMPFGPLVSVSKDLQATISLLGKDGGRYLFIVSRSLSSDQQAVIKFSEIYVVREWSIDPDTGKLKSEKIDTKNSIVRTISKGNCLLYSWEDNLNLVEP